MGHIAVRTRRDGTRRFQAQVFVKVGLNAPGRASRTHSTLVAAERWVREQEEVLRFGPPAQPLTLRELVREQLERTRRRIGRTQAQLLRAIQDGPLGSLQCSAIGCREIATWAEELAVERAPSTVATYLWTLEGVFVTARCLGHPVQRDAVRGAIWLARQNGTVGPSGIRDRRPTIAELDRLMAHFETIEQKRPDSIPMRSVILFALFSTRRLSEITRLRWADIELDHARALVRDMKHPGEKRGNDVWVDLVPEAVAILEARREAMEGSGGERLGPFPFNPGTIRSQFAKGCRAMAIEGLCFHSLRHEGVSRLFEMDWSIANVMGVSGHRTWSGVQRYAHLNGRGDKLAGFAWLPSVGVTGEKLATIAPLPVVPDGGPAVRPNWRTQRRRW